MNIFGLMSKSLIYGRVTTPLPVDLFGLCSICIEIQWNLLNFDCLFVWSSSLVCEAAYLLELNCFTLLCFYILWEMILLGMIVCGGGNRVQYHGLCLLLL